MVGRILEVVLGKTALRRFTSTPHCHRSFSHSVENVVQVALALATPLAGPPLEELNHRCRNAHLFVLRCHLANLATARCRLKEECQAVVAHPD